MKTPHTTNYYSTPLRTALAMVLALSFTACDSNPLDPIEDPSAMNPDGYTHQIPTMEVTYRVSSEKGVPSDIGLLMWVPDEGGMMYEKAHVANEDYVYTFDVVPSQLEQVRFMLNGENSESMLRAFIYVNQEIKGYGTTSALAPMVSIEMSEGQTDKRCGVN